MTPEAGPKPLPIPLNNKLDTLTVPQPPQYDFHKRTGEVDTESLGGKPRSLDFAKGEDISASKTEINAPEEIIESGSNSVDNKEESRRKRSVTDGNGNRVLSLRTKREASLSEEDDEAVEEADIETERVIRVVAPTDVQFKLTEDDKEEVVINTSTASLEALCIDTAAFVGVTITFLMLLIMAAITIVFLWLRIRAIDRKNLM